MQAPALDRERPYVDQNSRLRADVHAHVDGLERLHLVRDVGVVDAAYRVGAATEDEKQSDERDPGRGRGETPAHSLHCSEPTLAPSRATSRRTGRSLLPQPGGLEGFGTARAVS